MAQLDVCATGDQEAPGSIPAEQHSFVEIALEIFCTAIIFYPLIREGQQLSLSFIQYTGD